MTGLLGALPSLPGGNIQSSDDWLNRVFEDDKSWWSAQDVFACNRSHLSDEYLNGFIQTRTMDQWRSSSATVLWCRLNIIESSRGHFYPAACILRQTMGEYGVGIQWQAFSYNHQGVGGVSPCFPCEFARTKDEFLRQQRQEQEQKLGKTVSSEQAVRPQGVDADLEEIILLSLLLQARRKGLPVTLHEIDFNNPEGFNLRRISLPHSRASILHFGGPRYRSQYSHRAYAETCRRPAVTG